MQKVFFQQQKKTNNIDWLVIEQSIKELRKEKLQALKKLTDKINKK